MTRRLFEELDCQMTEIGEISLRRRKLLQLGGLDVFEVKLGDEHLMSTLFHHVEEELSDLSLAEIAAPELDVIVGGLGLGYTAAAALRNPKVKSVNIVEFLKPVIGWHQSALVPLGKHLSEDPRCHFVHGDFFALAVSETGFLADKPKSKVHAILLDIDHSPTRLLATTSDSFYRPESLSLMAKHLHPEGIFGMWSDDVPCDEFMAILDQVFRTCDAHDVSFENPLIGEKSYNTVYVCKNPRT